MATSGPRYSYVDHPLLDRPFPIIPGITQATFDSAVHRFRPADDDVIVASYPKCGTTWMLAVARLMRTGLPLAGADDKLDDHFNFLEFDGGDATRRQERPRLIKTHLPVGMTPWNPRAKYIFVARNAKDCVVSFYYHTVGFDEYYRFADGKFDNFFELFARGAVDYGDYFSHVAAWWAASQSRDNICFVLYEDMKRDFASELDRLANFLGPAWVKSLHDDNDRLLNLIIEQTSISHMKENSEKYCIEERPRDLPFIRKGVVGDWKGVLSAAQSSILDQKMANTSREFPGFGQLWKDYQHLLV